MNRITLTTKPTTGYELVDSGREEKLERFGDVTLVRPDPQAIWEKNLATSDWGLANSKYVRKGERGEWIGELPTEWGIEFGGFKFLIKPTNFKHTGLFPEQASNWSWIRDSVKPGSQVLNLFAYTGGATLAAAAAGAEVTHVDASKIAVSWARENAKLSGLEDKPIRWIIEDVLVYINREIKRGKKYDLIIMDPPAFGHGPNDELWKFEENFLELMHACHELLSEKPLGILINGYAAGYSSLAFAYNLDSFQKKFGGEIEYGDLTIEESGGVPDGTTMRRLLPCGIFARWRA